MTVLHALTMDGKGEKVSCSATSGDVALQEGVLFPFKFNNPVLQP